MGGGGRGEGGVEYIKRVVRMRGWGPMILQMHVVCLLPIDSSHPLGP